MKSRQEYIELLHRRIDEWNRDIDRLIAKKDSIEDDSRLELQKQIDSLKRKRAELENQAADLGSTGAEAWQDMKSGIDLAWEAMNTAVGSAVSRFLK